MPDTFTTERLRLTPVSRDDHAFMQELVNTPGWLTYIGDRQVHNKKDAAAYVDKIMHTPGLSYWVVRLLASGTPIGIVSFMKRDYLDFSDLGFALLPGYTANGYAQEAAGKILLKKLGTTGHPRILATVLPHNAPSISLLKKLGFQFSTALTREGDTVHVYAVGVTPA